MEKSQFNFFADKNTTPLQGTDILPAGSGIPSVSDPFSLDVSKYNSGAADLNFGGTASSGVNPNASGGFDWGGKGGANVAAGIGAVGGLANAFMAYKQYQLGKDTLKQNKSAFNFNAKNAAKTLNAQIEDRASRRARERVDLLGNTEGQKAAAAQEYDDRKVSSKGI